MTEAAMPRRSLLWVHPRMKYLLAFLAIVALIPASWWSYGKVMWLTPTGEEIARVVRAASTANELLLQPPPRYRSGGAPASVALALQRRALRVLGQTYTGERLTFWQGIARRELSPRNVAGWRPRFPAWTVDWVHLDTLTLLPGSTTATASAEVRGQGGVIDRTDYRYHLTHTSEGWRINSETFTFEPGYGP